MTTKSGFEYRVDPRILTDWRFTMTVVKSQNGNNMEKLAGVEQVAKLLIGEDQYEQLIKHISDRNDGFVPAEEIIAEMTEIMENAKETKN